MGSGGSGKGAVGSAVVVEVLEGLDVEGDFGELGRQVATSVETRIAMRLCIVRRAIGA
jgi:hypothetical protein